jgi:MFS family permease
MRQYASLLATARVRWMFVGAFLGRLPHAMESIGAVVFLKSTIGSFGVAGLVGGAVAAGIAFGSVVQGRRADRAGPSTLVPLAIVHVLTMGLLVVGGEAEWATPLLVLTGFAVGASVPPTSSVFRTLYPQVFADAPGGLRAAFALDSALNDVTYIAGPGLVSIGVLLASPGSALLFAAGTAVASALVLLLRAPVPRAVRAAEERVRRGSALRSPSIRTLTLATLPMGTAFGMWDVAFPAFGSAHGQLALGGLLVVLVALASSSSALAYGAVSDRDPGSVFFARSLWLAPGLAAPAIGNSFATVALLAVPLGAVVGPWTVARNQLTGLHALPGTEVEAYAWPITALLTGTAIGTALAGQIVEHGGWRPAVLAAGLVGAITSILVINDRGGKGSNA